MNTIQLSVNQLDAFFARWAWEKIAWEKIAWESKTPQPWESRSTTLPALLPSSTIIWMILSLSNLAPFLSYCALRHAFYQLLTYYCHQSVASSHLLPLCDWRALPPSLKVVNHQFYFPLQVLITHVENHHQRWLHLQFEIPTTILIIACLNLSLTLQITTRYILNCNRCQKNSYLHISLSRLLHQHYHFFFTN